MIFKKKLLIIPALLVFSIGCTTTVYLPFTVKGKYRYTGGECVLYLSSPSGNSEYITSSDKKWCEYEIGQEIK